jgi:hypothetical protein
MDDMDVDLPTQHSPLLPKNIWAKILDIATYVPFATDTGSPRPFAYPGTPSQDDIREELGKALHTKRCITEVCKQWYTIGVPLLYRCVYLRSHKVGPLLTAVRDKTNYLLYTARFDWVFTHETLGYDIVDAIKCFPNLTIFTSRLPPKQIGNRFQTPVHPTNFGFNLHETCRKLKVIDCDHMLFSDEYNMLAETVNSESILSLLNKAPLTQLRCRFVNTDAPIELTLDSVESLSLMPQGKREQDNVTFTTDLPRLIHLVYCPIGPLNHQFLVQKAYQLTSLELNLDHDTAITDMETIEEVKSVARMFPNLESIIVRRRPWDQLFSALSLPSIEHIGMILSRKILHGNELEILLSDICAAHAPNLRVVRFLDRSHAESLRRRYHSHTLEKLAPVFASRGIAVEDCFGKSFFSAIQYY